MMEQAWLNSAVRVLLQGGVLAYPTEAVFGLGCDPANIAAIERILAIKQRPPSKGLILIAANENDFFPYIGNIEQPVWDKVCASWPGPYTWVLPANKAVSPMLTGEHASIAVRVTDHPIARALCDSFGAPLVSTSANLAGEPPVRSSQAAHAQFAGVVDMIVPGEVGDSQQPTTIRNALTDEIIRGS